METATQERRAGGRLSTHRRAAYAGAGCATFFGLLLTTGMVWWQQISYVPHVAPLNRFLPVPNARDDFLAAISLLPGDTTGRLRTLYGMPPDSSGRYPVAMPGLRKLVNDVLPALKRLRIGLDREFANPPITSLGYVPPEIGEFYRLARLLDAESELALREGRTGDALGSGLDAMKLGEMVERDGPLWYGMSGIIVSLTGLHTVEIALDYADAESCARAAREIAELDAQAWTAADALAVERDTEMVILAGALRKSYPLQALASLPNYPQHAPVLAADQGRSLRLTVMPKRNLLENYRRNMEMEIARARVPYYAAGTLPSPPIDPVNGILSPSTAEGPFAWARQQAVRRSLLSRLAVRAYTLREGHPPSSLAALVPKYLRAVPQDPFAPAPLIYRVINGQPRVYSRGPDGDDDLGRDLPGLALENSDADLGSTLLPLPSRGGAVRPPGAIVVPVAPTPSTAR